MEKIEKTSQKITANIQDNIWLFILIISLIGVCWKYILS